MIIIYHIEKNVEKIIRGESTGFIEVKYIGNIIKKLKGFKYNIYRPFTEATKVIFYTNKLPNIKIYEIISKEKLRHQDILGTLYSLNISDEMFGDVIVNNDKYFIIILEDVENYIKSNLISIKNINVSLVEKNNNCLENYKQKFCEYELIVSSIRIDNVVSKIVNTSRNNINLLFKNKDIMLNYNVVTKCTYMLKENDIFSIRKFGKYKYVGIINNTKKGNYIIKYLKYI